MAFSLSWLADVLRNANLPVVEVDGWKTRGRRDLTSPRGVMCHHTAAPRGGNTPSLRIVTQGRPDLAGPLAQLLLARDGTYYVVAAGVANHAGAGNWLGDTHGNAHFIGIEAEYTGLTTGPNAEPWPLIQMNAYRWGVAAILRKIGAGASMCCGHREYALPAGRKTDPTFDMDRFRLDVDACMTINGASSPSNPLVPSPLQTSPASSLYTYGRYIA